MYFMRMYSFNLKECDHLSDNIINRLYSEIYIFVIQRGLIIACWLTLVYVPFNFLPILR